MNQIIFLLFMVAMIAWMFYSQRKQQKKHHEQMNAIQKGDEVITIGGLYGVVDEINDKKIVLDVDGVYLTFARFAIRERITPAKTESLADQSSTEQKESAVESHEE